MLTAVSIQSLIRFDGRDWILLVDPADALLAVAQLHQYRLENVPAPKPPPGPRLHAHAWVEVKHGEHWQTYDPTSGNEVDAAAQQSTWQSIKHFFDWLEIKKRIVVHEIIKLPRPQAVTGNDPVAMQCLATTGHDA